MRAGADNLLACGIVALALVAAGCSASTDSADPVDVVHYRRGPVACGWELVDFLTVGDVLGEPFAEGEGRTYLWDPVNLLSYVDGGIRNRTVLTEDLADTVVDSGLRLGERQLWSDPADPTYLYVVDGVRAERYELDTDDLIVCAAATSS